MMGGIKENPRPASGVAAWYENEETALCNSREGGWAACSPGDPRKSKGSPPQTRLGQRQSAQEQDHQEAEGAYQG